MRTTKIIAGILVAVALGLGTFGFGLGQDAPKKVKEAFAKKFPAAKKISWDKESALEWEAEFKLNGIAYSANFLEDGSWQETEHEISRDEVPANVLESLMKAYPGYGIDEIELSETKDGNVYEFEIEKGKTEFEVIIDGMGKVISDEPHED